MTAIGDEFNEVNLREGDGHGLDLLPEFLQDAHNLRVFSGAILDELNEIQSAGKQVTESLSVYTATGDALNKGGSKVGLPRTNTSDLIYRQDILNKISQAQSSGVRNEVLSLFASLTQSDSVRMWPHKSMNFSLEAVSETALPAGIYGEIDKAVVAGVNFDIIRAIDAPLGTTGYFFIVGSQAIGQGGMSATGGPTMRVGNPVVGVAGLGEQIT